MYIVTRSSLVLYILIVIVIFSFLFQVHVPSSSQQPGPLYFLVPYKIGIFGVMNDTSKRQCNYLIPEAASFKKSKGANGVVSFLHHYLQNFTFGEETLHLHADNCVVQNKNNCVMYLAWRVGKKLNKKITISFLPTGHTKFGPDYAFGLFKKKLRVSVASCINDIANIMEASTPESQLNFSYLVGEESGLLFIDVFDFQKGFKFSKIPNITKYAHFTFDGTSVGNVSCQEYVDGPISTFSIF